MIILKIFLFHCTIQHYLHLMEKHFNNYGIEHFQVQKLTGKYFSNVNEKLNLFLLYFSSPAVGYFNNDDIPDIMIHYQTGPGYPLYYSAEVDFFSDVFFFLLIHKIK